MGREINLNQNKEQKQQLNINPNDLEDMLCEKCESQYFEPAFLFKKLSAIMSPSGKETLVPMQIYRCADCKHINEEFLPKDQPSA
jgi:hypothetical protein